MAQFKIDRIRYNWKGIWSISTPYVKDDIVKFGGNTYVAMETHVSSAISFYQDIGYVNDFGDVDPRWVLMTDGVSWAGEWVPQLEYRANDIVKYRGILYQCIAPHVSAETTEEGLEADIEKWKIIARGSNWLSSWSPDTEYKINDIIKYNGVLYTCIDYHVSSTVINGLEFDQEKWQVLFDTDAWLGDWTVDTRYKVNDVIKYGGNVYRCTEGHTSADNIAEGLEVDLDGGAVSIKWELVVEGIYYRQEWQASIKYKANDIVQIGPSLYKARYGHVSPVVFDDDPWDIWIPGLGFEEAWNSLLSYQPGDIVIYGGYSYVAVGFSTGQAPSADLSGTFWQLLSTGYKLRGDYDPLDNFYTGDVVRENGYLYLAIEDVSADNTISPSEEGASAFWELLVTGIYYRAEWTELEEDGSTVKIYYPGDVVADESITYICTQKHSADAFEARPKLDTRETTGANDYWKIYASGEDANVLRYKGDLKTYGVTDDGSTLGASRLPVGAPGQVLKVQDDYSLSWEALDETEKVYWVSLDGVDELGKGNSPASPFRTIKYASEYILADELNRAPATIIVRTGVYQEQLPIIVPANCAITGDELRSTVIAPAPGYETENMFYVRNATGIRNCTLQGLTGTLGEPNENNTQRPTAGAYVSLDPGTGNDDNSVWITSKSPYIQNVTTFGTGCIGMKVDGDLHASGNKSIVANDFTQILSDGIGYWVNGEGKSELVSVFTYYCHIGYLATNGGKVRATNGNNSYGKYGSVAEGYDLNEVAKTAQIDNRTEQAQIDSLYSNGRSIFGIAYEHCGQQYTNASLTVTGTSVDFASSYPEIRQAGVSQIYITEEDSFQIGGNNYTTINGTAQAGDETQITLSGADEGTNEQYAGMRIFIREGKGFGQYAKIRSYNPLNRILQVEKESNGEPGWEHISGRPVAPLLDDTTKYLIEPRIDVEAPPFNLGSTSLNPAIDIVGGGSDIVAIPATGSAVYTSADGNSWNSDNVGVSTNWGAIAYGNGEYVILPASGTQIVHGNPASWNSANIAEYSYKSAAFGNGNWFAVGEQTNGDSTDTVQKSIGSASNWIDFTMPFVANWSSIAYGNDTWVAIAEFADDSTAAGISTFAVSTDDGATFQSIDTGVTARWKHIIFAYDKFIAIESSTDSTPCAVAISYDGLTWSTTEIPTGRYTRIAYQQGLYVMADPGTDRILLSEDGYSWREKLNSNIGAWTSVGAFNDTIWIVTGDSSLKIETGAQAKARASIGGGRVGKILIHDPGSGYLSGEPEVTAFDTSNTSDFTYRVYVNDGVLPQPAISNAGTGYLRATGAITGDGFAEQFQVGDTINLKNVTDIPGPGANVRVGGINDVIYFVTKVNSAVGSEGAYTLNVTISPGFGKNEAPTHDTSVEIRELYSQVRLTGHDFLDIGTGNFEDTNYPGLYVFGYESVNEPQPFNETVLYNGGRVFYTSTDQDGNFRVGELFEVEQATGTISINASFFDLGGLDELRLGGVILGGTGAVIREFSTDPTFSANSNNIVPTQKAIASYIDSRLASGGSDPRVNRLNAGEISISGASIFSPTNITIKVQSPSKINGAIGGDLAFKSYFSSSGNTINPFDDVLDVDPTFTGNSKYLD